MKAIDFANYTPVPTPDQVASFIAAGYTRAIVGCSYPVDPLDAVAQQQLRACADGGMEVEAYAFVDFDGDHPASIDRALAQLVPEVRRIWLDCEQQPPPGSDADAVVRRIAAAEAHVRTTRPDLAIGIYTGGWWWPNTGDSTAFSSRIDATQNLPLWTADYREPVGQPHLYGGWTEAAMWQWTDNGDDLIGFHADLNVILEEAEMTPAQMAEIKAYLDMKFVALIGWINDQHFVRKT